MKYDSKETIGYLTKKTHNSLCCLLSKTFVKNGIILPHSQFIILIKLYDEDGQTQQELAGKLMLDKAAIKRTVDNLIKHGFVSRSPGKRNNKILLTLKGRRMEKKIKSIALAATAEALGNIKPKDFETCKTVLKKLIENVNILCA
jgi:DNA-binding MarR family transcriptional regulator